MAATLNNPVSLVQLKRGASATIHRDSLAGEDASMLRAMGLRPDAKIRVCRMGRSCIVDVCEGCAGGGCRIGLSSELAKHVFVQPHV